MQKIDGLLIPNLTFSPQKLGDLIYYDGPLLSLFIDEERQNDYYLYRWVDNSESENRWLITKITINDLTDFFEEKLSLRDLVVNSQVVIVLDLDDELNKKQILLTTTSNLPSSYLPSLSSKFKAQFYHKYALKLRNKLIQKRQTNHITSELLSKVNRLEKQQGLILSTLSEFFEVEKSDRIRKPSRQNLEKLNHYQFDIAETPDNNYKKILN